MFKIVSLIPLKSVHICFALDPMIFMQHSIKCEKCGLEVRQASGIDSRAQARRNAEGGRQEEHPTLNTICLRQSMPVTIKSGRPKHRWLDTIRKDMKECGLCKEDALDREKWRSVVTYWQTPATREGQGGER